MPAPASIVNDTVAAVCPIDGVAGPYSAGDPVTTSPAKDGSLWRLDYSPTATPAQKTAAQNALLAVDPFALAAAYQTYDAAIAAGLNVTWVTSTALNGTYTIDPVTMHKILIEQTALTATGGFASGTALKPWSDRGGAKHVFSPPNYKLFAAALSKYVSQLGETLTNALNSQAVTWPPATVSINA